MEEIRCCIIDSKSAYRGIDREVDMGVFKDEKNSNAYENAYNQYLQYLSTEWQYTLDNLVVVNAFVNFIRSNYANSEVIIYTTQRLDKNLPFEFLGLDIVDQHLGSVIKSGAAAKYAVCNTNQYDLYCNERDANAVLQALVDHKPKLNDLFYVYVYALKSDESSMSWANLLKGKAKRYSLFERGQGVGLREP